MKTSVCLMTLAVLMAGALVLAQGFQIQPGTWEFTMSGIQGALPMDGIPPAMRAQLEAEMRKPQTYKSCVTAEDIKELKFGKKDDDDDECKVVTSKATRTTGDIVRECTGDQPHTETTHVESTSPQSLRASISNKTAAGTSSMTITGKWINARCKE